MSDVKDIGARIRTARNRRGLSETALARAAGVTRWRVRSFETGEHVVGIDAAARIIAALGIQADYALFGRLAGGRIEECPECHAPPGRCRPDCSCAPWNRSRRVGAIPEAPR